MSERLKVFAFGCVVLGASLAGTVAVLHVHLEGNAATLFATMYEAAPMVVAIAMSLTRFKAPVADVLGLRFRRGPWIFFAWMIPLPIALAAFGIAAAFPESEIQPQLGWLWFLAVVPFTAWGALLALPQEAAWRGFLFGALQPSFLRAWIVTGLAWGVWQIPLALLTAGRETWWIVVGWRFGFAIFATPLALVVRLRAGSVIASALLVGGLQATASAVAQATKITAPVTLVPLAIAAAIIATREMGTGSAAPSTRDQATPKPGTANPPKKKRRANR